MPTILSLFSQHKVPYYDLKGQVSVIIFVFSITNKETGAQKC